MIVVIAPDSFKGSLSAIEAAHAMALGVGRACPGVEIRLKPLADGGEGTLDAVLGATGGGRFEAVVTGAHGRPLRADFGLVATAPGPVAVIEAARVVGLFLPGVAEIPVGARGTRGVGELLRHCLDRGVRRLWIGLGGSATNDGGAGMLMALGARLSDPRGEPLAPGPDGLMRLASADFSGLDARLAACDITVLSDVDNPLCGVAGATAVFGPQKGVGPQQVAAFDEALARLAELGDRWRGAALSAEPGSGSAGGLGYALRLVGGNIRSGAEAMCELTGLDEALRGAAWLLTGEGRSDLQTPRGKAPWVAGQHARRLGVPATLISGAVDAEAVPVLASVFADWLALARGAAASEEAMRDTARLLAERAEEAARDRCAGRLA